MPEITTVDVTPLSDPKLRELATRIVNELRLAAEKAVAHNEDPGAYPMPSDRNSAEQLFSNYLRQLAPETRQAAITRSMSLVKASEPVRARQYGDLAKVNLGSATSVATQINGLPFPDRLKVTAAEIKRLALNVKTSAGSDRRSISARAAVLPSKLELRLHSVKCVDETNENGTELFGDDEIRLGGTMIGSMGSTAKIADFRVGDFSDGRVKNFLPPRPFATFDLVEGTMWPKSYFATLVLAEIDQGQFPDFVNRLLALIKDRVKVAVAKWVETETGSAALGVLIGQVTGVVVGEAIEWLKGTWNDDIFTPYTVSAQIPSIDARWAGNLDSGESVATFRGHDGRYDLTYDWRLWIDWRTDGALVRGNGPAVYLMQRGQRRWVPDPDTFNFMNLDGKSIQVMSDTELEAIPRGSNLPSRADGALVRSNAAPVYFMQNGQRRWIPNPETFNFMRLKANAVQWVSDADVAAIPPGPDLPSRANGALVRSNAAPVYFMQNGQRRWIPNPETFNFMRLNANAVQWVSDADVAAIPPGPNLPSRANGTVVKGSGPALYLMQNGQRRWIPDPNTFNAMRLDWNAIQSVSDADLEAIPRGQDIPAVRTDVA